MANIGFISLGCAKNQVDCERMMYRVQEAGHTVKSDVVGSDVVVINTCGFIDSAKSEAIDYILQTAALKAEGLVGKILVTGCLSQRYQGDILKEMPEVDGILGTGSYTEIVPAIEKLLNGEQVVDFGSIDAPEVETGRIMTTAGHYAFIKIAEGCDNRCTYCAIPKIRGRFRSRRMEDIVEETKLLAKDGVKEIVIIAQDVTRYGLDLYNKLALPELLDKLCEIEGLKWIRLLYCYPERVTDELIDCIKRQDKIVKYLDIPMQHCSDEILKRMNRKTTGAELRALVAKLRREIPGITLRTTFITGFPGETEEEFEETVSLIQQVHYDSLFTFIFSPRAGTPAASMDDPTPKAEKNRRFDKLCAVQNAISEEIHRSYIGKTLRCLVDGRDGENLTARTEADWCALSGRTA